MDYRKEYERWMKQAAIEYAKRCNADLMLATDPDCDRVGIAVKNHVGEYELLTGNQTGMLLLDYICSQRQKHHKMPADPVMVKTIVTMDMAQQIAEHYGLRTINVLTGFKFIGEQIGRLEEQKKADSYVFGFEESYGFSGFPPYQRMEIRRALHQKVQINLHKYQCLQPARFRKEIIWNPLLRRQDLPQSFLLLRKYRTEVHETAHSWRLRHRSVNNFWYSVWQISGCLRPSSINLR